MIESVRAYTVILYATLYFNLNLTTSPVIYANKEYAIASTKTIEKCTINKYIKNIMKKEIYSITSFEPDNMSNISSLSNFLSS